MLDRKNAQLLIDIAINPDTPPATRVSACDLLYKTNEMCGKDITKILQQVVDDARTKSGIQVKALALMDKVSNDTGREPELSTEDEQLVRTQLLESFVKCPNNSD